MEQDTVAEQPYTLTTKDIRISVTPEFEESRSRIDDGIYAYSYHVIIENFGTAAAQLINRHWKVFSAGKQIADVKGEGVVGEQPALAPGEIYEYTSWTIVRDEVGAMSGTYTFVNETGEFFDVQIPEFHLLYIESPEIH